VRAIRPQLRPSPVVGRYGPAEASAYYRVAVPLSVVGGAWAPTGPLGARLLETARTYVLQRIGGDPARVRAFIRDLQRHGKRVLIDYDDDPDALPIERTPGWHGLIAGLTEADGIVCTSDYLAGRLRRYSTDVRVVPNYVRTDWWPRIKAKPDGLVWAVLAGGGSHDADWRIIAEPLRRVKRDYPGLRLRICGALPRPLMGLCDDFRPWASLDNYPSMLAGCHIGLAPLPFSTFNLGKSPIKAYEYALAGLAVIGSPTQYGPVLAEGRGRVADTPDAWAEALAFYLDNPDVRQTEAAALLAHVRSTLDARVHASTIRAAYAA
jgi:glycosyltransferase involved in cell wall biosynthesis